MILLLTISTYIDTIKYFEKNIFPTFICEPIWTSGLLSVVVIPFIVSLKQILGSKQQNINFCRIIFIVLVIFDETKIYLFRDKNLF